MSQFLQVFCEMALELVFVDLFQMIAAEFI